MGCTSSKSSYAGSPTASSAGTTPFNAQASRELTTTTNAANLLASGLPTGANPPLGSPPTTCNFKPTAEEQYVFFELFTDNVTLDQVQAALDQNPNLINSQNERQQTPLLRLFSQAHESSHLLEITTLLLERKPALAHTKGYGNNTPLHVLFSYVRNSSRLPEITKILLTHNPDLNAEDKTPRTPLHMLFSHVHDVNKLAAITTLLLAHNPDLNILDAWQQTPLMLLNQKFTAEKQLQMVAELLDVGAQPRGSVLSWMLHSIANITQHPQSVINNNQDIQNSALFYQHTLLINVFNQLQASSISQEELLNHIHACDTTNINQAVSNQYPYPPLFYALAQCDADTFKLALNKGANWDEEPANCPSLSVMVIYSTVITTLEQDPENNCEALAALQPIKEALNKDWQQRIAP